MKKLILSALTMMTLTFSAMAADVTVATITNEADTEIVKLVVETDSNNVLMAMRKDIYDARGKFLDVKVFTPNDVFAGNAVMSESGNRKVVILKASKSTLSLVNGGIVTLDYLYSGISGERKQKSYTLKKNNGQWALFSGSTLIKKMHFAVNKKPIVGTIGIKDIIINK